MAAATLTRNVAGTDKDARLLKNRPLTDRQIASIKHIAKHGPTTPSRLAADTKVFAAGSLYAGDKARRALAQLGARGLVMHRKDGMYSLTPKGKRIADK